MIGEDSLALGEEAGIGRRRVSARSVAIAAGIVLRWASHFELIRSSARQTEDDLFFDLLILAAGHSILPWLVARLFSILSFRPLFEVESLRGSCDLEEKLVVNPSI